MFDKQESFLGLFLNFPFFPCLTDKLLLCTCLRDDDLFLLGPILGMNLCFIPEVGIYKIKQESKINSKRVLFLFS